MSQAPLGRHSSTISTASSPCCWGETCKDWCLSLFHPGSEWGMALLWSPKSFWGHAPAVEPKVQEPLQEMKVSKCALILLSLWIIIVERVGKLSWIENFFFESHYSVLKHPDSRLLQLRTRFISRQLFLLSFQRPILILNSRIACLFFCPLVSSLPRSYSSGGEESEKRQKWTGEKMHLVIYLNIMSFYTCIRGKYWSGSDQLLDLSSILITISSFPPCCIYSLTGTCCIIQGAQHKIKIQGLSFKNYY